MQEETRITLTEDDWTQLDALSYELRTQDNMATGWPVFTVYEKLGKYGAFATACFSNKGAEAYMAVNGHNMVKPFIYVETGHRNAEWQLVRKLLLALPNLIDTRQKTAPTSLNSSAF